MELQGELDSIQPHKLASAGSIPAPATSEPPVRLCCGQRHYGPMCPDGMVMCCLCFGRFAVDQLNVVDGQREDVCKKCADLEKQRGDA